jgi:hypothetical protein
MPLTKFIQVHGACPIYDVTMNTNPVHEGLFAFFGQNPTPDNPAKLPFTIGIPSGLRSA